ncbi:MAG: hypothetical protein ACREP9_21235 [Candidatus Dormibacteraceae bacterium]
MNTFTYDAEGRVASVSTSSGLTNFIYYANGQLAETVAPVSDFPFDYAYDPFGMRQIMLLGCPACGYDAEEYTTLGNRWLAGYNENNPRETDFYHFDRLGSLVLGTQQTGSLIGDQVFGPFGQAWLGTAVGNIPVFAGTEHRDVANLDVTANREYGSTYGRWLQPDPANAGADPTDPQT